MSKLSVVVLVVCGWLNLVISPTVVADRFAVRRVTNFGNPTFGSTSTPLAAVNGQLLFYSPRNSSPGGLYRTDGTQHQPIDHSIRLPIGESRIASTEFVPLGSELFFEAKVSDIQGLYATDGFSLRKVADNTAGTGGLPGPQRIPTAVNDRLLFDARVEDPMASNGMRIGTFSTDGTTIHELPSRLNLARTVILGQRLIADSPNGVTSTDGVTVTPLNVFRYESIGHETKLTRVGNDAYFVGSPVDEMVRFSDIGIYRTDGLTAELTTPLATLALPGTFPEVDALFELDDALYIKLEDFVNSRVSFFRIDGETTEEVLRWQAPVELTRVKSHDEPLIVASNRAYFRLPVSGEHDELFLFDGATLVPTGFQLHLDHEYQFSAIDGRIFMNTRSQNGIAIDSQLFELVDENVIPLGTGLEDIVLFAGELFGVHAPSWGLGNEISLWQIEEDHLVPYGNLVSGLGSTLFGLLDSRIGRFVEFDGRLYFNGTDGRNEQLYALGPVPEPSSALPALTGLAFLCAIRLYTPRPKGSRRW